MKIHLKNKWIKPAIEIVGITFITLLLLEITLRLLGKYDTVAERVSHHYNSFYQPCMNSWYLINKGSSYTCERSEFTFTYPKNSVGLFTKEITPVKQKGHKRIFTLGDSFTQGIGAPPDSCWPVLLQNILASKGDSTYEIYNAGTGGSDPFFAYRLLADKLMNYQEDEIIFVVNGTDVLEYIGRGGLERFNADSTTCFREAPWFNGLYGASYVARFIITEVFNYNYTLMHPAQFDALKQRSTVDMVEVIKLVKKLCDAKGIKLLVVVHPGVADYSAAYLVPDRFFIFNIIPPLRKSGIDCLDMRPGFAKVLNRNNGAEYAWPVDGHFKAKGYNLFANIIYKAEFSDTTK